MADPSTSKPDIQMIATDKLIPNSWNANEMSTEAFEEYVAEVKRLGEIPKPIIVRPVEGEHQVVDGEHAWRAAKEAGFTEVPCQVQDIEDFEAMTQTFRRNLGGTNNPLLLGQMFVQMKKVRKLSNRKLAQEIEIAESTIRNHLAYVRAFDQRSRYTPEKAREEIEELCYRQVRIYLELPELIANKWLDAGASVDDVEHVCKDRHYELGDMIVDAGLADLLEPTPGGFRKSLEYTVALCEWRDQHRSIKGIDKYICTLAELRLPVWLLDELPCAAADGGARMYATPKEWAAILKSAASHAEDGADLQASVQSGVRLALGKKKVDIAEVLGPRVAEQLQLLESAPEFIRKAHHMTLDEQHELAAVAVDGLPEGVVLRAKEMACDQLRRQRSGGKAKSNEKARRRAAAADESVVVVFRECLQRVQQEEALAEEEELFADQDRLVEAVRDKLSKAAALDGVLVEGRPPADVLAKRLDALDWPEYFVLATCILHTDRVELAAGRWLKAVADQVPQEADNDDDSEGVVEKTEPEEENHYEKDECGEDGYEEEEEVEQDDQEEDEEEEEDD